MRKCPGQDTQFWTPEDLYEVPCPICSAGVEFFKDDVIRRCGNCGHLFRNPRLDLACAEWCAYADQCVPQLKKALEGEEEGGTVKERLLKAVREDLNAGMGQTRLAVAMVDLVRELMGPSVEADSRVVVAAAALAPLAEENPQFEPLLDDLGFDGGSITHVGRILRALREGLEPNEPEFDLIHDARLLSQARVELDRGSAGKAELLLANRMRTEAAAEKAQALLAKTARGLDA